MKLKSLLVAVVLPFFVEAQDYNIALIPDSIKENAIAVTRFEERKIIVHSPSRAVIKHKYAITILNPAGDAYAQYENYYSNMRDLYDISGNLYDAEGRKLKSVRRKEIADVSDNDGISLMNDDRIKLHRFNYKQYPYTVEYEDQMELKGIISFTPWMPVGNQRYGVQESNYVVEIPADYGFRIKQFNFSQEPVKVEKDKKISYSWQLKNFKPIKYEPFQPAYQEVVPCVYVAPNRFSYGGIEGEMDNWLNFGKYQVALNKGRDRLPENIKQQVQQIARENPGKVETIKALYNYLQKNTRYVSVQLGIGGLQPFDATYVATKNYGDCKALSNYMIALLKEAGIEGYYTVIYAGEGKKFFMPDFPMRQSNHIIVSVPVEKDTMWLECTSQTQAAGYLGSFTDDRYALLIKEDGGHLVRTPTYKKDDNLQVRRIQAAITEEGKLTADVVTKYVGLQQDDLHMQINAYSKDKLLEKLKKKLDFPTYDIATVDYQEKKDVIPSIEEKYKLTVENFATVSGKRLFVAPNLLTKQPYKLEDKERKFEIDYDEAFVDYDTIQLAIPAGYTIEAMPKDAELASKFGTYKIQYKFENGMLVLHRRHESIPGRYPPSEYKELVSFFNEVYKADRSRIVFVKS
ncbi:DUF3857 domain-containing protein [Aridibaculum aurantiacum]|uniref:DUF3857 domain-containing protein n=1 Tax=Aridibaculum aurantiacum TaxID=2810307 RepID=UPI001A9608E6|nr:DUF3857 domain-containing protein [Aridibaculum aurantiacum]